MVLVGVFPQLTQVGAAGPLVPTMNTVATSEWGYITEVATGWSADTITVYHTQPIVNPRTISVTVGGGGCKVTNNGYATDPADPGRAVHHAAIFAAFLNHKAVRFFVQSCVFDKPRVISVDIRDGPA